MSGAGADKQQAAALHGAALAKLSAGDAQSARQLLEQAIGLDDSVAAYHVNLAIALRGVGTHQERIALYQEALALNPGDALVHANLCAAFSEAGDFIAAERQARIALRLAPGLVDAQVNLGGALAGQKRFAEAAAAFDAALAQRPDMLHVLVASGRALRAAGALEQALPRLQQAQSLIAALPAAQRKEWTAQVGDLLGDTYYDLGRLDEAGACFRAAAAAAPGNPSPRVNLGFVLHALGHHEAALAEFCAAQALDPRNLSIYGNIGTCLTYSFAHAPRELKECYDVLDRVVALPLRDRRPHNNERDPQRRLRVGYLSPDFREHVVAYFALPLLEGHRRENVELYCYYNGYQQDAWTQQFKNNADHWLDCAALNDAELAERIRADGIDILVDLAGHTLGNRLKVFARKPAPVQVTWMGYVTTTGLSAIDYRLTHADADPPGVDDCYAEQLVRLQGTMWCFRPLPGMPDVAAAPFLRKGHVTFGSFNRFSKISPRVLDAWAAILAGVPESRLVLCIPEGKVREETQQRFAAAGVAAGRLTMYAKLPHAEFWALHAEVDIALDPFPFNGGTTSCETLWLGVPLVTCTGGPTSFPPRFASRMGYTFLNAVGLPELALPTEAEYVRTAIALAHDPARMQLLRASLRAMMQASPLVDIERFVSEVEESYRTMWRGWVDARRQLGSAP